MHMHSLGGVQGALSDWLLLQDALGLIGCCCRMLSRGHEQMVAREVGPNAHCCNRPVHLPANDRPPDPSLSLYCCHRPVHLPANDRLSDPSISLRLSDVSIYRVTTLSCAVAMACTCIMPLYVLCPSVSSCHVVRVSSGIHHQTNLLEIKLCHSPTCVSTLIVDAFSYCAYSNVHCLV